MGIFDWLLGKKSKDKEEKDVGIEKGRVKKKKTVKPKRKVPFGKEETLNEKLPVILTEDEVKAFKRAGIRINDEMIT